IKGRDLQDYVYNEVTYPPSMYMGLEQRIIAVQQIMGGNEPYATRRWAIEFLGITDHPDEMMKEIDEDQLRKVEFQKKMAEGAQTPQPQGGGGPPSPLEKAVSMESGSTKPKDLGGGQQALPASSSPAPTPPGGPAASSSAAPPPAGAAALDANVPPNPDVGNVDSGLGGTSLAQQVQSVIGGITLKGHVYVAEMQGGKRVEVYAPDRPDLPQLRRQLYPLFTKGRVVVKETKKIPDSAQEVKGRAQGGAPNAGNNGRQ